MHSKTLSLRTAAICLILCLYNLCSTYPVFAQQASRTVTGKVLDENKQPMPGVAILIVGTTSGGTTDFDGNFTLSVPAGNNELQFSFIGYETVKMPIPANNNIRLQMKPQTMTLDDVVVIGYGTSRKGDLTGAVANVSSKDFNEGMISSPEQLINGKIAGVQIMSNSGSPTAGSTIRIRGGASLNASNDPLIVLDGVPLEIGGISGNNSNFLSLINPNDIESMTVLKDASSTAIYGSRASNGVIIITTKKGADSKLKISFNTTNSLQVRTQTADMLSRGEFINIVNSNGTDAQKALLGMANTDWNDEIYNVAFGTDNNLSFSGKLKNIPYRVSLGYYNQDGILRTDNAERITGNISVSPGFFNNYLKFNVNIKGSLNKNRFANGGAIWAASTYNPTLPVHSGNDVFGGYTEAIDNTGTPVTRGVRNPLGLLRQYKSTSDIKRVIGNADVDYKLHFLPELKFHATVGYDYAEGKGKIYVPEEAAEYATTGGRDFTYGPQINTNRLLTTYLNYNKTFGEFTVDATAGYDYQAWKSSSEKYSELNVAGIEQKSIAASDQRHVLLSYYGRLNLTYDTRYMLTATIRRDGTSRFNKDNRWGTFPSLALAWRISEESFLENWETLSNLKLRGSYGVTGQQDGIGNYNYLPVYTGSQSGAEYQFGNAFYPTYRPEAYASDLKWETTTAWNAGIDFGFFNNRLSGSVDFYTRKTKDLLATVPSPAGTNFDKTILTNVGNVDSHGLEFGLNVTPVDTKNITWDMSFNATWQRMKIQNLSLVKGTAITNTSVGPTIDSYYFQVLSEGYEPYMFYLYHQLYDEKGKPIEGAYADLNDDGEINSDDLYRYKSPSPDWILGFSTSLRYKKWNLGMSFRANIGNYVYNGMAMNTGAWNTMSYNDYQLNNLSSSYLKTGFRERQFLSDYYVENASFLKMDNITLTYNFGKIWNCFNLNASAMVQNVFTVTNYSGVDPEVPNGMDSSFYPRPRIFSLGLGLDF
ncbi:SusC/RagA family TonB-linked outer membrane protein [Culturomica massiliensis]|mgnify:FL=1|jgi:TonB-linked SusC/RagA family outer membrane protein|uniref:SusC/RagA family TonB-linked outer membrane protein n=1 Tax=Culturomica massiliensis TaxID=1841857 RepID=UPI000E55C9BE|nr:MULTISPECIES: TonB-dependent receptor [Odoribacteraceae]RHV94262.1 TonB-dependent receptor [Odoribacter sp. OF09-27XD]